MSNKADMIGTHEIFFGSYKRFFDAPDLYREVKAADIKAAAAKYFRKNNRTVGILEKSGGSRP